MERTLPFIGLNSAPKKLLQSIVLSGKKVDPLSGGIMNTESFLIIRPGERKGIFFRVGDREIPYDKNHLEAFDSSLGRMMRVKDATSGIQIVLVEHLLSALALLGVSDAEIVLDESCFGPLTSTNVPIFGLKKTTYWVPVLGPGVSGFIDKISPFCSFFDGRKPTIVRVTQSAVYEVIDPKPKYKGLKRSMCIEPADKLAVQVDAAHQPDIHNNPEGVPMSVAEGEKIEDYLKARPIMRLRNKFEEIVLFILNLRSFALTRETYFRSKSGMTKEQVVARMHPVFQEGQNEHFYHTALADFPGELGVFLGGNHLHARIILSNTNHLFRMEALKYLLGQNIFKEA